MKSQKSKKKTRKQEKVGKKTKADLTLQINRIVVSFHSFLPFQMAELLLNMTCS